MMMMMMRATILSQSAKANNAFLMRLNAPMSANGGSKSLANLALESKPLLLVGGCARLAGLPHVAHLYTNVKRLDKISSGGSDITNSNMSVSGIIEQNRSSTLGRGGANVTDNLKTAIGLEPTGSVNKGLDSTKSPYVMPGKIEDEKINSELGSIVQATEAPSQPSGSGEVKGRIEESSNQSTGQTNSIDKKDQDITANLPSKEQVEKFFFRFVAFIYDVTYLTGNWAIRFIDQKVVQNETVKDLWKKFHDKMEKAKKD